MRVNDKRKLFVFLIGVLLVVNFVWGNYVGLYVRRVVLPMLTFLKNKLPDTVENQNMSTSGSAMMHTLYFNNTKPMKLADFNKTLSEGFLNIYDISNGSSVSAQDKTACINTRFNPIFAICIYDTRKDVHISGSIRRGGQWEAHITTMLSAVLKQSKPLTFVDIGANIGYFSLISASLGHYAVAVEPWTQHLQKFAQSIYINKFQDKIVVLRNAVSNYHRVGHINIKIAKVNNQGAAQLLPDKANVSSDDTITTSTIQLDDLAPLIPTTDIILKFDIEGHECRAIEKSNVIFDTFRVILIFTEWGIMRGDMNKNEKDIACPPENIQQMAEMLSDRGFVPYGYPNKALDVKNSTKWKDHDVYWKPQK